MPRSSWAWVISLAVACLLLDASQAKKGDKKQAEALTPAKLSKYIKCDSCMAMGENLYALATKVIAEKGGRKKTGEEPILEILEGVCDAGSVNGEWINKLDVVGDVGKLRIQEKQDFGKCGAECKAVTKVCEDVRLKAGESDIAEKLYRGHYTASASEFASALCNKMTDTCKRPVPELKTKRVDEKFRAIDSKEWEALKIQRSMKDMGMGGKLYDRASMKDMLDGGGDAEGEEEEDGRHSDASDRSGGDGRDRRGQEERKWERSAYWWEKLLNGWIRAAAAAAAEALQAVRAAVLVGVDVFIGYVRQAVAAVSGKPKDPDL